MSDEQILALLKNGRSLEKGFRMLVELYQKKLYWQIRRMVLDHEDANDVLQNVFIKVYRNISSFQERSGLSTWLYRIALNETLTYLKSKKRKTTITFDTTDIAAQLHADPYFDGDEAQIRLQEAIAELPEKQRAVFNLRYFDEMPYEEMSKVMGTSVGALKASYHHAVKKIESFIKAYV